MSGEAHGDVLRFLRTTDREIKPAHRLILLLLANRHNTEKGLAWPSLHLVAREAGYKHVRNVQIQLAEMEAAGLIERIPRYADHGGLISNGYRIACVRPAADGGSRSEDLEGHTIKASPPPRSNHREGSRSNHREVSRSQDRVIKEDEKTIRKNEGKKGDRGLARGARTDLGRPSAPAPPPDPEVPAGYDDATCDYFPQTPREKRRIRAKVTPLPGTAGAPTGSEETAPPIPPAPPRPGRTAATMAEKRPPAAILRQHTPRAESAPSAPAESPTGALPAPAPVHDAAPVLRMAREWRDLGGGKLNAAQCKRGADLLAAWTLAGRAGEFWSLMRDGAGRGWRWSGFVSAAEDRLSKPAGLPSTLIAAPLPVAPAPCLRLDSDPRTWDPRTYQESPYHGLTAFIEYESRDEGVEKRAATMQMRVPEYLIWVSEEIQSGIREIVDQGGRALPEWGGWYEWARTEGLPVWE